ncbi:MAG TPA: HAMP domain-containing sensor histidine kinase [Streptosporangiaceae bacterium]
MTTAGAEVPRRNWPLQAWTAVRSLSERTSLRTKLISAVLVLVLVALTVIDVVSITQLRSLLTDHADQQLEQVSNKITNAGLAMRGSGSSLGSLIAPNLTAEAYSSSGQVIGPVDLSGHVIPVPPTVTFSVTPSWLSANANGYATLSSQAGGSWRAYVVPVPFNDGSSGYLITASDFSDALTTIHQLTGLDIIVSVVILFVLAVVGFVVVQANLRPLVDIEETAGEIAEGHLERRVPERDPRTEIGSLGRSLNTMLSQIESAFHAREESEAAAHQSEERMRRFIADASHELRTPLTAIRGFAEYYRQRGGLVQQWDEDEEAHSVDGLSAEDLDRIMHRVEAEAARMGLLVEDLLLLARMDQQRPLSRNPVDLLSLAADAVHDAQMIAPNRAIDLKVQPGAAFLVIGDEARLRQVIGNLMTNALTHTPDRTPIELSISSGVLDPRASAEQPAVILDVKDQGPGMAPEQAQRVFERFYRADQARNRKTGGSGLGLAIVAALVAAHGGVASVRTAPGQGATFRVALPLAPEAHGWDDGSDGLDEGSDPAGQRETQQAT